MKIRTAAGALMLGAVLAGCTGPAPGSEPTVTVTPAPVATRTAAPSPTPTVRYLSTVTVDPLLPSAEPLPEGLLASTVDGWTLVRYDAEPVGSSGDAWMSQEYLLSPDGHRYQLPDHPGWLAAWRPGSTTAVATLTSEDGSASVGVVDLEAGSWSPVDLTPVVTLQGMTARDVSAWVQLAPNDGELYVTISPWAEDDTASLTRLDLVTGLATEVFEGDAGTRSLEVSPDGAHLIAQRGDSVTVASVSGELSAAEELPGCTASYAWWLSETVWAAACAWSDPRDVESLVAVHPLDGRVWGVPSDDHLYTPLTARGDEVWAEAENVSGGGETLLRLTREHGVEPFALVGEPMTQFTVLGPGRLIATNDTGYSDDGYGGLPAPVYSVDLDSATTRLLVPEPDGANAYVIVVSLWGGNGLWHRADDTWQDNGE